MTTDKTTTRPTATPENTPVPGGGRWRWDQDAGTWLEVLEQPAPITATEPTPE